MSLSPTFTLQSGTSGQIGDYYTVDGPGGAALDPQVTAGRPVEPRLYLDVTAPTGARTLPAHGVLVTDLSTGTTDTNFDAAFSRPTLDNSADEPETAAGDVAYPSRLATVTTSTAQATQPLVDSAPQRQRVAVIPGQFLSDGTPDAQGIGTQRLYDHLGLQVLYSTSPTTPRPSSARSPRPSRAGSSTCRRSRRTPRASSGSSSSSPPAGAGGSCWSSPTGRATRGRARSPSRRARRRRS